MYQNLYRKYRPTCFDEVVGQKIIITTLKNAVEKQNINHAYLFTGPRGTGKTSVAKILAKTINCEKLEDGMPCNKCVSCTQINNKQSVDIIEIDAASNNGVDEIRELKSKINLVPSTSKYKVYIIDEVHMLTTGAFNALLKTLEEPPEHIIFILATTEPHKIPLTILSRCQRFDFKKIHENEIYNRLEKISLSENIEIDKESLVELSRLADGGLRDALSLFDQVIAYTQGKIKIEDVHEINGTLVPYQLKELIQLIVKKDIEKLFTLIDNYDYNGKNFVKLSEEIIIFLRNCLLFSTVPSYFKEVVSNTEIYKIDGLTQSIILKLIEKFNQIIHEMKMSNYPKILFETTLIVMITLENKTETEKEINKEDNSSVKKTTVSTTINQQNKEHTDVFSSEKETRKEKMDILKNIRINNTLCQFNKKDLINWKEKVKNLEEEINNQEIGKLVSFILDGNLKAVGNQYLIFIYENEHLADLFNDNITAIEQLFEKKFQEKIRTIATDIEHWEMIKDRKSVV